MNITKNVFRIDLVFLDLKMAKDYQKTAKMTKGSLFSIVNLEFSKDCLCEVFNLTLHWGGGIN